MNGARKISRILESRSTIEGAGVHLKRAFGNADVPLFDPFLMLDDFRSEKPEHYSKGFPWHPHRGIETITYVLRGDIDHGDSMGNRGIIRSGDVQWMTAGSGIVHQEMPLGDKSGYMWGFQLWANLPAAEKMMAPRYRDVKGKDIPEVITPAGVRIKIICGEVEGIHGPVRDIVIDPEFLDVTVPAGEKFTRDTKPGHTVFAYVIDGKGFFIGDDGNSKSVENMNTVLFEDGGPVSATAGRQPFRFLLIAGKPLREPIAWRGPIVMNTQEELDSAFLEYKNGTFIK